MPYRVIEDPRPADLCVIPCTAGMKGDTCPCEAKYSPFAKAYAQYDADPRVNGPDDYLAFRDAVIPLVSDR